MAIRRRRMLIADESGAAMLEFLLVIPLLLLLVFAVMQYGMMLVTYNSMYNTARESARRWAVGELATEASAEVDVLNRLSGVVSWVPTADWDVSGTAKIGDELVVSVQLPSASASLMSLPMIPMPASLVATVVIREE